jgi:hypothetical protein
MLRRPAPNSSINPDTDIVDLYNGLIDLDKVAFEVYLGLAGSTPQSARMRL